MTNLLTPITCQHCGTPAMMVQKTALYCSVECRVKAARRRQYMAQRGEDVKTYRRKVPEPDLPPDVIDAIFERARYAKRIGASL